MIEQKLAHNVFFSLKDTSSKAVENLIEECFTYLKDSPGIKSFHAGRIAADHKRDVNVTDFQVSLHIIFSDKTYHDQYQVSENHNIFVERGKENWAQVRVFDSYVK